MIGRCSSHVNSAPKPGAISELQLSLRFESAPEIARQEASILILKSFVDIASGRGFKAWDAGLPRILVLDLQPRSGEVGKRHQHVGSSSEFIAQHAGLQEIPQRVVLESTKFSESQGLLTASGKLSRAALVRRVLSHLGR